MRRRDFIISTALGLTAAQAPTVLAAGVRFSRNPFTLGVASGDVTQDSVVLWTRLAPEPLAVDGGVGQAAIPVQWELFQDKDMQRLIRRGEELAVPELAHSVHVDVQGLEPGREYWYRFFAGTHVSAAGRTKTLPAAGSQPESIRIVSASCQNYTHGYFVAYEHIIADNPDFVIHLGDYIYDTSYGVTFRRHDSEQEPATLTDFRRRHALYKTDEQLQRAHARLPFFTTLDNHDAVIDTDPAGLAKRAAAYQAWYEHMPLRDYNRNRFQLKRTIRVGELLQLSLLDTRQHRANQFLCPASEPAYGYGNYRIRCPDMFAVERSMLGQAQERWLTENILNNKARWNVIASSSVFLPFNLHIDGEVFNYIGSWDAYPANRDRVVAAIDRAKTGHAMILSGDLHSFWAIDGAYYTPATPAVEFVTSSISANWPEPMAKPVSDNLDHNPQVKFYEPDKRGYLLHEVTAREWQTTARAVHDVRDARSKVFDLARFAVENGKSGIKRVY